MTRLRKRAFPLLPVFPLMLALLLTGVPARAGLAPADLERVEVAPPADARLPLDARTLGEEGLPYALSDMLSRHAVSVVLFVDYTCNSVCGTALAIAAASLADPSLTDLDAGLIVIGIDPKDGIAAAKRQRAAILDGDVLGPRAAFLTAVHGGDKPGHRSAGIAPSAAE